MSRAGFSKRHIQWVMWAGLISLVPICIFTVDRPLAQFAASHQLRIHRAWVVLGMPGLLLGLALIAPILNWNMSNSTIMWRKIALICSSSVLWTTAAVELVLKRVFGRSSPASWLDHREFAFHWFRGRTAAMQSMPSGEAAVLAAVLAVLWTIYPRGRWFYILIGSFEAAGLIWFNWHFASDVIVGLAVGALGAKLALRRAQ